MKLSFGSQHTKGFFSDEEQYALVVGVRELGNPKLNRMSCR